MLSNMKKLLLTLIGVLVCAGLFVFVYHNYQAHPKATNTTVPVAQYEDVKAQLKTAQDTLALHDRVNEHNLAIQKTEVQRVTTQRNTLCTQYKNARPVPTPALCQ